MPDYHRLLAIAKQGIPKGIYCYGKNGICYYWDKNPKKHSQECGYCHYLEFGDWETEHLSLLWDQVKECGINDEIDEEDWS